MRRLLALAALLALIAGCVNIPEEQLKPIEPPSEEAPQEETAPAANESAEPLPLAPLPANTTSKPAVMPKATVVNSSASTAPSTTVMKAGKANVPTTWTTEALSIEEGETKIIYVAQPQP